MQDVRRRFRPNASGAFTDALNSLDGLKLIALSGGGNLADPFAAHTLDMLNLIEIATSRQIPVALVGQGIGPLSNPALSKVARKTLPKAAFIAVRDRLTGPELLRKIGVSESRIPVTGDDAVELAFNLRTPATGCGIGINIRIAQLEDRLTTAVDAAWHSAAGLRLSLLASAAIQIEQGRKAYQCLSALVSE